MLKSIPLNRKVTFFIPSLRGGGAEKVLANLASGLAMGGLQVDLVLADAAGEYLLDLSSDVRVVDLKVSRVLAALPGLVSYLRRERPGVLVSALEHANVVAILARHLSCIPVHVVASVHAPLSYSLGSSKRLVEVMMPGLVRMFYSKADAVVAVSQGVNHDLIANFGLHPSKVRTIYNPIINNELYDLGRENISHPWFAPHQPPVLLAVGRLTSEKDYATLIRAFSKVRQQRLVRLLIFGEGPERQKLEVLVRELGLTDDVMLPGFVHNPYAYMSRASCLVLSSVFEGFGNVIVEALAMGCPVVSTDCPVGPSEILEGGKWGLLVPVGDHDAMAAAIVSTLGINGKAASPLLNAYLRRFGLDEVMPQYLDAIFPDNVVRA